MTLWSLRVYSFSSAVEPPKLVGPLSLHPSGSGLPLQKVALEADSVVPPVSAASFHSVSDFTVHSEQVCSFSDRTSFLPALTQTFD